MIPNRAKRFVLNAAESLPNEINQNLKYKLLFPTPQHTFHCLKSVLIRSYSGLHFPTFGLNTERYSVSLRIQSKYGKMQTRINTNTGTFHAVLQYICKSFIQYAHKSFQKSNISYTLICTRTCTYQGVRNVSISENFANVLNE